MLTALRAAYAAVHPKVKASAVAGAVASAAVAFAHAEGHDLPADSATYIAAAVMVLAGWLKKASDHNSAPVAAAGAQDDKAPVAE